jgi:CheY-like chemotaxis protein
MCSINSTSPETTRIALVTTNKEGFVQKSIATRINSIVNPGELQIFDSLCELYNKIKSGEKFAACFVANFSGDIAPKPDDIWDIQQLNPNIGLGIMTQNQISDELTQLFHKIFGIKPDKNEINQFLNDSKKIIKSQEAAALNIDSLSESKYRILFIDDQRHMQSMIPLSIKILFTKHDPNAEVITAASGQEALRILNHNQNFDLIVTDFDMKPDMNGIEFVKEAKKLVNTRFCLHAADVDRVKSQYSSDELSNLFDKCIQKGALSEELPSIIEEIVKARSNEIDLI